MSKLRRPKKAMKRLDIRVRDYEVTRARTETPQAFTCPGSLKK